MLWTGFTGRFWSNFEVRMVKFGRSLNQTRRPLSQTTDQTSRQLIKIPSQTSLRPVNLEHWAEPSRRLRRFGLVAKSLWCKNRQKLPKTLSRPARHYLLKKSDVEHPLFKRSAHTQDPPACAASFPGPSREKRRRRCILAVATEGDSTPLRSEIKL